MAQNHDYEEVSNRTQNFTDTVFVSGGKVGIGHPTMRNTLEIGDVDNATDYQLAIENTQFGVVINSDGLVSGVGASPALLVQQDGSTAFRVNNNSYVGVGLDTPITQLTVSGFTSAHGMDTQHGVYNATTGQWDRSAHVVKRTRDSDSGWQTTNRLVALKIDGSVSGATHNETAAGFGTAIEFTGQQVADQSVAMGIMGCVYEDVSSISTGYMFQTRHAGSGYSEKIRINSQGDIGVNTSSPESNLHIVVATGAVGAASRRGLKVVNGANTTAQLQVGNLNDSYIGTSSQSGFNINTHNTARIAIRSDGNVGIGTGTAHGANSYKLNVAGTTRTQGDALFDENLTVMGSLSVRGDLTYLDTEVSVTSAMEITNSGTGPALKVQQTGTQPIAHFIDTNGDDVIIADDGKLGLGIATPNEKLTVAGNISASGELMLTNGGGFLSTNLDHTAGPEMKIYGAVNKTVSLYFGDIEDVVEGGITYDTSTSKLFLKSHNNHTAVTIDSNENVGIGTTAPINNLHVDHAANVWGGITIGETGVGAEQFHISHYGGTGSGTILTQEGNLPIRFNTNDIERMRVAGDGRVGIGTTNPEQLLHIEGDNDPGLRIETTEGSSSGSTLMYMNSSTQLVFAARNHDSTTDATMQVDISPIAGPSATTAGGAQQLIRLFRSSQPMNTGMEFMKPGTQANAGAFRWKQNPEELRLGIGTGDPSRNLHIKGNPDGENHGLIRVESVSADEWAGIEFYRETSGGEGKGGAWIGVQGSTSTTTGTLEIGAANNAGIGASGTVRMRISDPVTEIMDSLNIVNDGTTPQVNLQSADGLHGWRLRGNVNNSTYGQFVIENVSSAVKDGATRSAGSDYLSIDESGEVALGHDHHIKFNEGGNGGDAINDGADIRLSGYGLIGSEGHMYITAGAGNAQGSLVFKSGAGKSESSTDPADAITTSTGHNLLTLTPTDASGIGSRGEAYFYTPLRVGGAIGAPLDTAQETTRLYTLSAGNGITNDRTKRINGLDGDVMGNDTFIIEKGDSEHYNPDSGIAFVFHSRDHHTGAGSTAGFDLDVPLHLHPRGNSTGTNREDSSIQTGWPLELYGQHSGVGSDNYTEAWSSAGHGLTVPVDAALINFQHNYYNDAGEGFKANLPVGFNNGLGRPTHIHLGFDAYGFGVESGTLAICSDSFTRFYGLDDSDNPVEGALIDTREGIVYTNAIGLSGTTWHSTDDYASQGVADTHFRSHDPVTELQNRNNVYMFFNGGKATSDWAYLRQIGPSNRMMMALDFHDDSTTASSGGTTLHQGGLTIRSIESTASTDVITNMATISPGEITVNARDVNNTAEGGQINIAHPGNTTGQGQSNCWSIDVITDGSNSQGHGTNQKILRMFSTEDTTVPTPLSLDHDGNLRIDGSITQNNTSDRNLKENIVPISKPIDKLKKINGVTFTWKEGPDKPLVKNGDDIGVIAQEVEAALPLAAKTNSRGWKCVDYEKLIPLLIESVKDQQTQIEDLKQQIADLQSSSDT